MSVDELTATFGSTPGLAVVLVGSRRDSASYVKSKKKACAEVGIRSIGLDYPEDVSQEELIEKIDELNAGKLTCQAKHFFFQLNQPFFPTWSFFCRPINRWYSGTTASSSAHR